MRLRWSSPSVILLIVFNLVFFLVGCASAQSNSSAAGLRYPPVGEVADNTDVEVAATVAPSEATTAASLETGQIPRLMGFVEGTDFPAVPTVVPRIASGSSTELNSELMVEGGRIHIGLFGVQLANLDPSIASTPSELVAADVLFDGLTKSVPGTGWADGRNVVVPSLAATWGERAGGYWEFVLAERTFSDGARITAGDVKASFERAVRQAGGDSGLLAGVVGRDAFLNGEAPGVSGIRAMDDGVILIALDEPNADFDRDIADVRLGVVNATDLSLQSSDWSVTASASNALRLSHNSPEGLAFTGVDLLSYADREALLDGYTAGEVEVAMIGGGTNAMLSWSRMLDLVETRPDGTFDILGVQRK